MWQVETGKITGDGYSISIVLNIAGKMGCYLYLYHVHFRLSGLSEKAVAALRKIAPLTGFSHHFSHFDNLQELDNESTQVVLFTESCGISASEIRRIVGRENRCILCAFEQHAVPSTELKALDDIWCTAGKLSLLRFYFQKLQKQMKEEKDHWLCENYLEQTINTMPDLVWYKDLRGAHLKVNDAFCKIVGKTKKDIEGRGHYYIWGLTKEQYEQGEFVCLETEEEVMRKRKTCLFDEQVIGPEGLRRLKTYKTPIFAEDGTLIGTLGIARDVTREYEYQEQILELARTDELTGVANRRYFQEYVERQRGTQRLTVIGFDLDRFKQVNDTHGHQTGDAALMVMGDALRQMFPEGFSARMGGDEFVTAFLGPCDTQRLEEQLMEFIDSLREFFSSQRSFCELSVSAGMTWTDNPAEGLELLLHHADLALYQVKEQGRSRYCLYHPSMG